MRCSLFAAGLGAVLTLGLAAPADAQFSMSTVGLNRGVRTFVGARPFGYGYGYGYGHRYVRPYARSYGYSSGYRGVPRLGYGFGYPGYGGWWGYPGYGLGYGSGYGLGYGLGYRRQWVNPYWRYGPVYGLRRGPFMPW